MADRKIIVKIVTGSHLYGTSRPESDTDYQGIFLPSTNDLLGLQECPKEWSENVKLSEGERNTKDDVDCKYYSLKRFIQLAGEGQPGQLELLFAPQDKIVHAEPEWLDLVNNREAFLSKKAIAPFVGFATAQAIKASLKGETLNYIRSIIETAKGLGLDKSIKTIHEVTEKHYDGWMLRWGRNQILFKVKKASDGTNLIEVGGKAFNEGCQMKRFIESLEKLESKYGSRSRAAADNNYDFKSLMHAYRLMFEAQEFLRTGKISLPLQGTDPVLGDKIEWLKKVRDGHVGDVEHTILLDELKEAVRAAEEASELPEEPNWKFLNQLCKSMQLTHLEAGGTTIIGIDPDMIRMSGPSLDETWNNLGQAGRDK